MTDDEPDPDEEDDYPGPFGEGELGNPAMVQLWRKRNAEARALLGDTRLKTFFKAGLDFSDGAAFDLIYEALARGEGLDILTRLEAEFGYVLGAECLADYYYRIEFGYRSNDGWNDGGVWLVRFSPLGAVADVDLEGPLPHLNGMGG